jgi:hypothetical protein
MGETEVDTVVADLVDDIANQRGRWAECPAAGNSTEVPIRACETEKNGKCVRITKYRQNPPWFPPSGGPLPYMLRFEVGGNVVETAAVIGSRFESASEIL